ncbi:acyl-CoA/acyl-ACP dehydrogenase [Halobacillus shinanisalinarum]|uniref:Acyl-CoA/acyl-ACP dehydrogenase n=1 Tax=Halobacillus shinanisalinarum TaxID=2932258 RepID=A0ABY4H3W7_9BACI|nr:acyl-CoA dehydrogenase family protein [Halobacillus shinanisalinarum]UOQ94863.1 acyl-CoA/acyl-ACP dehydrogenase [Halobacillus shinanisalinarum]
MSDMQEIILDSTNKMFKSLCSKELIDQLEEGIFAEELWSVLVESGITSVGVPESLGGTGGDYNDALHILQLYGRFSVPLPLSETLMVQWLLADHRVPASREIFTLSVNLKNKIEIEETTKGYSIRGKAVHVPWARHAKSLLVLVNFEGASKVALLPLEQAGVEYNSNLAGEPSDTVNFESIDVENIFLEDVEEEKFRMKVTNLGGLIKTAMMSGAMEALLELSVLYSKEREQFGRPLHRLQAIQQHIAVLSGETVASVTIANKAIQAFGKGMVDHEIAAAKLKLSESAGKVTEIAHQLHGAIGVTHEHRLNQVTRRLWAWRDEFGNENYWADQLAEKVMSSNKESLWEMITDRPVTKVPLGEGIK